MVAAEHLALHQCSGHRIVLAVADIWILWLCSCRDQNPHIIKYSKYSTRNIYLISTKNIYPLTPFTSYWNLRFHLYKYIFNGPNQVKTDRSKVEVNAFSK